MTKRTKLLQGGDGTAVPAGMVGYQYVNTTKNTGNPTSGQFFDGLNAAFNLPIGVYDVYTNISITSSGAPASVRLSNFGIGTSPGNDVTGYPGDAYAGNLESSIGYATGGIAVSCNHRLTVTNASQNYYLKGYYAATGTPGTITIQQALVRAVRIA